MFIYRLICLTKLEYNNTFIIVLAVQENKSLITQSNMRYQLQSEANYF